MKTITTLLTILLLFPPFAMAHGGGLDKSGCHHDRKSGGYHCHNGGTSTQSPHISTNSVDTNSAKPQSFGILGEQTVKAIKHFQVDSDTAVDGEVSYLLLEKLLGDGG